MIFVISLRILFLVKKYVMNNTDVNSEISIDYQYIIVAFIKLGLSLIFSIIISIERELHSHPGGACTHILVGLGSCLYTMISVHMKDKYNAPNSDPARICAQIVSGMGFLGSATIFKSRNFVKGINTAANLWISAAISMSIGAGLFEFGLVTSFFVILVLILNSKYKKIRYGNNKKNDIETGNIDLPRDVVDEPYDDINE